MLEKEKQDCMEGTGGYLRLLEGWSKNNCKTKGRKKEVFIALRGGRERRASDCHYLGISLASDRIKLDRNKGWVTP